MRNIVIDHVATGVWKGRCSYPNCGIGVSSVQAAAFASVKVPELQNGEKPDLNKEEKPSEDASVEPEKPVVPAVPAQPQAPASHPTAPVKVQPKLNTAQLIENSKSLLKFKHDRDVERLRSERRQPA
jgi:hypothetical protein